MIDETRTDDGPDVDGDSSDVVSGPIGSAHLVEPKEAGGLGADLEDLPVFPADADSGADPEAPSQG